MAPQISVKNRRGPNHLSKKQVNKAEIPGKRSTDILERSENGGMTCAWAWACVMAVKSKGTAALQDFICVGI